MFVLKLSGIQIHTKDGCKSGKVKYPYIKGCYVIGRVLNASFLA